MYGNLARPKAQLVLWLACHGRLATKDRLHRFGMIDNIQCCFCSQTKTLDHQRFECCTTRAIWMKVLSWLKIHHVPSIWTDELVWL